MAKKTSKTPAKTAKTVKKSAKRPAKKAVKIVKKTAKKKAAKKEEVIPTFQPSGHLQVPKHEILTEDQIGKLYEEFRVQPTNLPTIYITDAALRGMDVKMGDVIKVTRTSLTAGTSVFYRRVAYE